MYVDRIQCLNLLLELPSLGGWQHAHTSMPHIDKRECMAALEKVHERGVLHGNLKLHHVLRCRDMRMILVGFANARALVPMPQYGIEKATEADLVFEKRKLAYLLDYDNARANEEKRTTRAALTPRPPWTTPMDRDAALTAPFNEKELASWRKDADATSNSTFPVPKGDIYHEAEHKEFTKSLEEWLVRRRKGIQNNTRYHTDRAMPQEFRPSSAVSHTKDALYYVLPEIIAPLSGSSTASLSQPTTSSSSKTNLAPSPVDFFAYHPVAAFHKTTPPHIARLLAAPDSTYNSLSVKVGAQTKTDIHKLDIARADKLGLRFMKRGRGTGRKQDVQGLGIPMRAKLGFNYPAYRAKMAMIKSKYHSLLKDGKRLVHGRDRPQVTDGPPILRYHEVEERKKELAHMYQPSKAPGVPTKSVLRRPLYRPCVDQSALEAMNLDADDGAETEQAEFKYADVGLVDVKDSDEDIGNGDPSTEDDENDENIGERKQSGLEEYHEGAAKRKRLPDEPDIENEEPPAKRARTESAGGGVRDDTASSQQMTVTPSPSSSRLRPRNTPSTFVVDDPTRTAEQAKKLLAQIDNHILRSHDSMLTLQSIRDRLAVQAGETSRINTSDVLASVSFFN